ncbi:MAG: hypothetical protein IJ716_13595 [Lachnospiraceae bacterium]|nr:hypothetical protein [Lachnospiraceae bacterium]
MEQVIHFFKSILNAITLAGVIVLFIGLFYVVIKAGIPYQDSPLELQIKYAVNMGIGEELTKVGFWIAILGGVARILMGLRGLILKWKEVRDKKI